jgi:hypothetical protein
VPAAREVIQKMCGPVAVASVVLMRAASAAGMGGGLEEAERFLGASCDRCDDVV